MLTKIVSGLVELIFPRICLACKNKLTQKAVDNLICGQCWQKIKKNTPPFCHCCGRKLEKTSFVKNVCAGCIKKRLYFDRAYSPCLYTGVIKELIHEFKYGGKDYLGQPLSRLMVELIKEFELPMDYLDFIIPVPLHSSRLREREFNQAQVLSWHIAAEFKKSMAPEALIRHRPTKTQTELAEDKRLSNVKGSFLVTDGSLLKAKNVLLVDDVMSTGATCSEAALAMKNAGANIVFVLTLAC